MARPTIEIDWKQFDKLCEYHCTLEEIAGILGCSADTIERRVKETYEIGFAEYYAQKSSAGKKSIRRKQLQLALKGNPTMLIWLGKQWLGQKETSRHELTGADGKPIETNSKNLSDDQLEAEIQKRLAKRDLGKEEG